MYSIGQTSSPPQTLGQSSVSVYLQTPELTDLFNITQPVLLPHCTHKQSPRSSTSHPAQWKWSGPLLSSRRVCPYGSFSNGRAGFSGLQWTLKRRARGSVTPLIPSLEDSGSATMAAATQQMSSLPSGLRICSTVPDILYLPELVRERNIWCSEMTMVYHSLIRLLQNIRLFGNT